MRWSLYWLIQGRNSQMHTKLLLFKNLTRLSIPKLTQWINSGKNMSFDVSSANAVSSWVRRLTPPWRGWMAGKPLRNQETAVRCLIVSMGCVTRFNLSFSFLSSLALWGSGQPSSNPGTSLGRGKTLVQLTVWTSCLRRRCLGLWFQSLKGAFFTAVRQTWFRDF